MVQINFAQKTVNVKIVYYGPGMSGKTTNLEVVHQRAPAGNRGDLTSISTDGDRTLFFDYLPLELGTVAGMKTSFQLYTVPGQVYYNSTRKLVLQGVDGVIFVADSSASMLDQNLESLRNLEENLNEYGKSLATLPHVLQWNKRDLPDAMSLEELEQHLNHHAATTFEGIANTGQGVFPTLKSLAAQVLKGILDETASGRSAAPVAAVAPAAPAADITGAEEFGASAPASPLDIAQPSLAPAASAPPAPMPMGEPQVAQAASPAAADLAPPELTLGSSMPQAAPAQPMLAQPAVAPVAAQAQPAQLMQPTPAQAQPRQQRAPQGAPGAVRRAKARQGARRQPAPAPQPAAKSSTGLFLVLAAGVGAAIAYAVQHFVL